MKTFRPILAIVLLLLLSFCASPEGGGMNPSLSPPHTVLGEHYSNVLTGIFTFGNAQSVVEEDEVFENFTVRKMRYSLLIDRDPGVPSAVDVNLCYPQLMGLKDKNAENTVNLMLMDLAFKSLVGEPSLPDVASLLHEAQDNVGRKPAITDQVAFVDYQILYSRPPYLSIHFYGYNVAGATEQNTLDYYATINFKTATYANLTSIIDLNVLSADIYSGNYEVLKGNYLPGGWVESEVTPLFVEALSRGIQPKTCPREDGDEKNRMSVFNYNIYDSEMFALCDDSVIVRFTFLDSLAGYVVLKIPKLT